MLSDNVAILLLKVAIVNVLQSSEHMRIGEQRCELVAIVFIFPFVYFLPLK